MQKGGNSENEPAKIKSRRTSVPPTEAAVTQRIAPGWNAHIWFVPESGGAIGKVEVLPESVERGGLPSAEDLAAGGLTVSVLRAVNLRVARAEWSAAAREVAERFPVEPGEHVAGRGRRTPERLLALVAMWYEEAIDSGSAKPVEAVEQRLAHHGMNRATSSVRKLVVLARQRGYLTPAQSRRAGGRATQKAEMTLKQGEAP